MEKNTNAMEKASCAMEDAAPMGEGISRRSFLGLGALGAAGLAALGLAGCAPQANNAAQVGSADVAVEAPTAEELPAADTEESCDVVVVGLGTSGLVAASAAAKEGAKVIGLDRSASMGATNAAMVSGVWAVESSPELQYDNHLTTKDMFDFIWTSTHYQTNAPLLRNVLPASGKGIDLMIEGGVPFMFAFEGADENTLMLNRGGHIYATSGAERAEALQGMLDKFGVDSRWDAEVTNLLIEDGAVVDAKALLEKGILSKCEYGYKVLGNGTSSSPPAALFRTRACCATTTPARSCTARATSTTTARASGWPSRPVPRWARTSAPLSMSPAPAT